MYSLRNPLIRGQSFVRRSEHPLTSNSISTIFSDSHFPIEQNSFIPPTTNFNSLSRSAAIFSQTKEN